MMTPSFKIFLLFLVVITLKTNAQDSWAQVGSFTEFYDIGSPGISGEVSYLEPSQTYLLSGSGKNIWFGEDSFSFLTKAMSGDFIIETQIRFIGAGHEEHRKTGIMFRNSVSSGSPMVACTVHGDGLTSLQFRKMDGGEVEEIKMDIKAPDILRLEKNGSKFIMSVARFGEILQSVEVDNLELEPVLISGLFVCAHTNEFSEEVAFSNTRVYNTAPKDLVQYSTYIGSLLEVMDIETGQRQVLTESSGSMQAPNWTLNNALIYNENGLLYKYDISAGSREIINTDFANKNNNDHVLTFDGKQLGISHHAKEDNGSSVIYTLPVTGGIPKRVTSGSPSYLHGWSPDNQFMLYTAERKNDFDIYKIAVEGGKEIQLTSSKGLDDGSEYSPDGKYIYFNSTRTGTMQLWRMDADGKNQTQLTFDEFNNWFPHVSPDNKWIVFISFSKEVQPDKHPFYQRVYLRMMPVGGGETKVIGYLYGGQGTINVPSWSPNSKRIAFVSNGTF